MFGHRYRRRPGRTGDPVRADTVEKALAAVGQGMADMGGIDPRKQTPGAKENHPLLASFLKAMRDEDDPSLRAYPANVMVIEALSELLDLTDARWGTFNAHVRDLIIVAFFWLLRPAEYLVGSKEARSQAFEFKDINFLVNNRRYPAPTAPLYDENIIARLRDAHLTFSDQKNAVRGEQVGHKATNDELLCPVKALGRIAKRLHDAGASPDTPIYQHYNEADRQWYSVKPQHVTDLLRKAATKLQSVTGIDPKLVSCRSLHPGGATALMLAGADSDHIKLLGRWKSDAMLRYLRIQAATQTNNFSQRMLDHGRYTFAPTAFQAGGALPNQAPPLWHAIIDHVELYDSDDE